MHDYQQGSIDNLVEAHATFWINCRSHFWATYVAIIQHVMQDVLKVFVNCEVQGVLYSIGCQAATTVAFHGFFANFCQVSACVGLLPSLQVCWRHVRLRKSTNLVAQSVFMYVEHNGQIKATLRVWGGLLYWADGNKRAVGNCTIRHKYNPWDDVWHFYPSEVRSRNQRLRDWSKRARMYIGWQNLLYI